MCDTGHVGSYDEFHDYLADIEPIRLREPLAETLGAVKRKGAPIEYTFVEVVKLAGHACPTTASAGPDPSAMCFRFRRKDNGKTVLCRIYHDEMPSLGLEKAKRLGELMPKVLWEAAKKDEISEFRRLWMDSAKLVFEIASTNNKWLKIEEVN